MKISIEFSTDNAAFKDDYAYEINKLISEANVSIIAGHSSGSLQDTNGNTVGRFTVEGE